MTIKRGRGRRRKLINSSTRSRIGSHVHCPCEYECNPFSQRCGYVYDRVRSLPNHMLEMIINGDDNDDNDDNDNQW